MQISKLAYEKLLAAAQHAKAETARANEASHALMALGAKYEELKKTYDETREGLRASRVKVEIRDEALVQLALRLSFHGDAEPIAGTE
jgi:hypothetical protein